MLTVYGIETVMKLFNNPFTLIVATVLTVYGIETNDKMIVLIFNSRLQQCLPFTVLKRI